MSTRQLNALWSLAFVVILWVAYGFGACALGCLAAIHFEFKEPTQPEPGEK